MESTWVEESRESSLGSCCSAPSCAFGSWAGLVALCECLVFFLTGPATLQQTAEVDVCSRKLRASCECCADPRLSSSASMKYTLEGELLPNNFSLHPADHRIAQIRQQVSCRRVVVSRSPQADPPTSQVYSVALLHGRAPTSRQAADHPYGVGLGLPRWILRLQRHRCVRTRLLRAGLS